MLDLSLVGCPLYAQNLVEVPTFFSLVRHISDLMLICLKASENKHEYTGGAGYRICRVHLMVYRGGGRGVKEDSKVQLYSLLAVQEYNSTEHINCAFESE
jgi:hypothetical protein